MCDCELTGHDLTSKTSQVQKCVFNFHAAVSILCPKPRNRARKDRTECVTRKKEQELELWNGERMRMRERYGGGVSKGKQRVKKKRKTRRRKNQRILVKRRKGGDERRGGGREEEEEEEEEEEVEPED